MKQTTKPNTEPETVQSPADRPTELGASACSHLLRTLPEASFKFGDWVNVRCEEAGCPPSFVARVVAIRLIHGQVDYSVMDADGWTLDGYSEDWLSRANATPKPMHADSPTPNPSATPPALHAAASSDWQAADGKHYWNCWTSNYIHREQGYIIHAFCEEDRTGKTLCGVKAPDGSGLSIPHETVPGCIKCTRIMQKRGALSSQNA